MSPASSSEALSIFFSTFRHLFHRALISAFTSFLDAAVIWWVTFAEGDKLETEELIVGGLVDGVSLWWVDSVSSGEVE